jgi:hypothetical protein
MNTALIAIGEFRRIVEIKQIFDWRTIASGR